MPDSIQCIMCTHYRGGLACDAFPDRIPQEIITGEFDHRHPHPGDHGIRFEPTDRDAQRIMDDLFGGNEPPALGTGQP